MEIVIGTSVTCHLNEIMTVGGQEMGWAQNAGFPYLGPTYSFPKGATTKYHKLGALKQEKFILLQFGS